MGRPTIEIIGPPGIGKSALYHTLVRRWTPASNWIPQSILLGPARPAGLHFSAWLAYGLYRLKKNKAGKSIPADYGLRFAAEHEAYAALCWELLSRPETAAGLALGPRFRAAYFLFLDFCRYQAIKEKHGQQACLLEEGLLQKSFLLQDDPQGMETVIREYVSLVPLPQALIYIDTADQQVILDRLRRREKTLFTHRDRSPELLARETSKWQRMLALVLDLARQAGVAIYPIDGARPLRENAALINQILTDLKDTRP
ncbi:MAG: hypothetical protein ACO1O1_00945 [Adhaeribacter sp.]